MNLPIAHHMLLHPLINVTAELTSGMLRDPDWSEQQASAYFPTVEDRFSILAAPGRMTAEEAKQYFPSTTIVVADQDPFKEQNDAFAILLQNAGISCGVLQAFGSIHDVEIFAEARKSPTSRLVMYAISGKIREVLG
jgi:acetyl esterase/lipase